MNRIEQLYHSYANEWPQKLEQLPISGSNRRYYRVYILLLKENGHEDKL